MKVENLIYAYLIICLSMIVFNCVYVFIIRHQDRRLEKNTDEYDALIREQLERIEAGEAVSETHKKFLCRKLKHTAELTAFDRSLEKLYGETGALAECYLTEIYSVFLYLSIEYQGSDTVKAAYFPYIVSKYHILNQNEVDAIAHFMFELLRSSDVYCRENALKAIYDTGRCENVVKALKIIDANPGFHHPKLVCDGLLAFCGDRAALGEALWEAFSRYSPEMQVNILNFFRFGGVRDDERMLDILTDETRGQELRFACIRYFEKYPLEAARTVLQNLAENHEKRVWEYQAIATSALKAYPDARTTAILTQNLSNTNWYVRLNAAISCEKLGFSYTDMIHVFDGDDRYAREMLGYRLDRRAAEKEVAELC